MKTITKNTAAIIILLCMISNAYSQKVGSTSMQFLKITPSARGSSLGDAYSVWASGADAVFWNPAGLALEQQQDFTISYVNWIFESKQTALSYATPIQDVGVVAVQLQYVDFGEFLEASALRPYINKETDPGLTGNTFHPHSYLIGFSYAANLTDRFSTGLSVKYAHESLYNGNTFLAQVRQGVYETVNTWGNVVMFDFGMRYNTGFRSIQIGAAVQNFGPNVKYAKESNPIPMQFRFGVAANVVGNYALLIEDQDNRFGLAFDLFQPNDYSQQEHLGIEYEYSEIFALRAGYKINYDYEKITFGFGVKQPIGSLKISLDYSYGSLGNYLGAAHRISLGAKIL